MGPKRRPHPSPPDGGDTFPSVGTVKEQMTEADIACDRARKVCTRILGELDAWLAGETHHTEEDQHGTE